MENNKFNGIIDGVNKELEVLYTFYSIKTKKDYIIYTDNEKVGNSINVYSSIYYPFDKERKLEDITDDKDWKEIEAFLKKVGDVNE